MDSTEGIRRIMVAEINSRLSGDEKTRYNELCAEYGADNVYDTQAMSERFTIDGFMAPFVVGRNKETGEKGSLMFCHSPRFYFGWQPDNR